ncbi:MAG TPA: hypothetical protein VGO11_07425 [Chthoniobacteraceae bacterium]|jgi:hypothetical protein|nr:hypothetical protein [Chthoniobacteraceae bacterium]
MSAENAFQRVVHPVLQLLLQGKEDAVLAAQPDEALRERVEELASKCTEGELTPEERKEYEAYARADKFVAILRRSILSMKAAATL